MTRNILQARGKMGVMGTVSLLVAAAGGLMPNAQAEPMDAETVLTPREHPKIARPGRLTKQDARVIYDTIADHMADNLAISGEPVASQYRRWWRVNDAPFLSATHGSRYVNIYANPTALRARYNDLRPGIEMPPGAVLAKDSFTFTDDRALFIGALSVMEKLAKGEGPNTADWRYLMILPDGSVFADSSGQFPETATFCHTCHIQAAAFDYLFFLPEEYRRRVPGGD